MKKTPVATDCFRVRSRMDLQIAITNLLSLEWLSDLSEVDRSLVCTIASELGTNILKYGAPGEIHVSRYEQPEFTDVEVKATDRGPGIPDVQQAMAEHYSTSGTLGLGLPGVKRIADSFEISAKPGLGTTVIASKRIAHSPRDRSSAGMSKVSAGHGIGYGSGTDHSFDPAPAADPAADGLDVGFRIRSCSGHRASGDQICVVPLDGGYLFCVLDVTGHGLAAGALATEVIAHLKEKANSNLEQTMKRVHERFEGTVGFSLGLAHLDLKKALIRFAGVGNTALVLISDKSWRPVSKDGVVGVRLPSVVTHEAVFKRQDILIMHSDGLSESGASSELRRQRFKDASTIAHLLVENAGKTYDDASCLVVKWTD